MSGEGVLSIQDMRITNEEVSPGTVPQWLLEHLISQLSDDKPYTEGGLARILVIYPNSESRREIIGKITEMGYVIDNTLHHTISSLMDSLMSDFRMPKKLQKKSSFELILHEECKRASAKLEFPIINPMPNMNWSRGKTTALTELHFFLSSESQAKNWNGPGIKTFRKILFSLEKKLNRTYGDFLSERLIDRLADSDLPFSLTDIDGIIMLNHSPTIPKSHIDFMMAVSCHCPIHQLGNAGNIRLGKHGMRLIDQWAIVSESELPKWVPKHDLSLTNRENTIERVLLEREDQSFEETYGLVLDFLSKSSEKTCLIIDPNFNKNKNIWNRGIKNLTLSMSKDKEKLLNSPLGHWIYSYLNLPYGNDAFSLEKLKSISLQKSIPLYPKMPIHPTDERISPNPDIKLLTKIARSNHILGGPGALSNWLKSITSNFDITSNNEEDNIKLESTQWWLLCICRWLNPLLIGFDRESLQDCSVNGVFSKVKLPLPNPPKEGDKWLHSTIKNLCDEISYMKNPEELIRKFRVIQSFVSELEILRSNQAIIGHKPPVMGPLWIEEISFLIKKTEYLINPISSKNRIRVMPIGQALGCTADLAILANVSSNSWNLRVPKMHFIGERDRHERGLLRPDGPIRNARHNFEHILKCASKVVILDSHDESNPPATPIREWLKSNPITKPRFNSANRYFINPRHNRSTDGRKLSRGEESVIYSINYNSVTISLDKSIQKDRERRQPLFAANDGYLPDENSDYLFSFNFDDMVRKTPKLIISPRFNERWPVISAINKIDDKLFKSQTIDPRPFNIRPLDIEVSDSRHGLAPLEELKFPSWSPTRLQQWLRCPRSGWLIRSLKIEKDESQDEDLDARTNGEIFHRIHHQLILDILNFKEAIPRNFEQVLSHNQPINLFFSQIKPEILMKSSLLHLNHIAPWLNRNDAVSVNRVRLMTGMSIKQWGDWLDNPQPIPPQGRIGRFIEEELLLKNVAPIAIEWDLTLNHKDGIEISLPKEITSPHGDELPPIRLKGKIDRVDLVPFDVEKGVWINNEGSETVAPLKIINSGWEPRRLVLIRDIKTTESTKIEERHYKGLFEELQLALYARSWEIDHPGDLVVGAGISTLGYKTSHFIELSSIERLTKLEGIGLKTSKCKELFRFLNENESPSSDPFRAWLASRISVALNVSERANKGFVNPIPEKYNCSFCSVKDICDVKWEGEY